MQRARKWLTWIVIAYVTACWLIGCVTTEFYTHHVHHAWRFTPEPDRARRWGLNVSQAAVTFPDQSPSSPVKLSEGWIEWGGYRRVTIPYVPVPEPFLANRYSMKFDRDVPFRALHFQVALSFPGEPSIRLAELPPGWRPGCSTYRTGQRESIHCSIRVLEPRQDVFRGHAVTAEGRTLDGSEFVVRVAWPEGAR